MTTATVILGHQFNVAPTGILTLGPGLAGGLKYFSSRNQFDEHGDIVSLKRLRNETNWEYRRRIQDAMVHIANSSYRGMVYGITRELGLSLYDSITINPKVDIDGRFLAPDPYVKFDGVYLYLYSDYANGLLDWAVDRFEPGGNYEHIGRLVDFVNTTSSFEASMSIEVDYYDRSMTIFNQSNRGLVTFERVPNSTKFSLKHDRLIPGTVIFGNRTTFKTEVATEADVDALGKYYIDYFHGVVRVFTIPTISDIVRYQYVVYPFETMASPVILHDITDDTFKAKLFQQVFQDDGTFADGIATELGVDIINELLSEFPLFWGK